MIVRSHLLELLDILLLIGINLEILVQIDQKSF